MSVPASVVKARPNETFAIAFAIVGTSSSQEEEESDVQHKQLLSLGVCVCECVCVKHEEEQKLAEALNVSALRSTAFERESRPFVRPSVRSHPSQRSFSLRLSDSLS